MTCIYSKNNITAFRNHSIKVKHMDKPHECNTYNQCKCKHILATTSHKAVQKHMNPYVGSIT